jgi:hypothetical protein
MIPKDDEPKVVFGFANCGWFNALKKSNRSWRLLPSFGHGIGMFRMTLKSMLNCPGPSTIPVALSPKAVPMPSAPITGGLVKHDLLK